MKRKMIMGLGAILLVSAGVFAGNKFKAAASAVWAKSAGGVCHQISANATLAALNTVSSGAGAQAIIKDESGTSYNLYENSGCTTALYYNF